jgi:hypothetical protein
MNCDVCERHTSVSPVLRRALFRRYSLLVTGHVLFSCVSIILISTACSKHLEDIRH